MVFFVSVHAAFALAHQHNARQQIVSAKAQLASIGHHDTTKNSRSDPLATDDTTAGGTGDGTSDGTGDVTGDGTPVAPGTGGHGANKLGVTDKSSLLGSCSDLAEVDAPAGTVCQYGAITCGTEEKQRCPILVQESKRCKQVAEGNENPICNEVETAGIKCDVQTCAKIAAHHGLQLFVVGKEDNAGLCWHEDTAALPACVGEACCKGTSGFKDGKFDMYKVANLTDH